MNAPPATPAHAAETVLEQVRQSLLQGRREQAVAQLQHAVAIQPDRPELLFALAGLLQDSQPRRAGALFDTVLALQPGHAGAAFRRAEQCALQGTYRQAAHLLETLCRHTPADAPDTLVQALQWLTEQQLVETALRVAQQAEEQGHRDARLAVMAGRAAMLLGQFEQAREYYQRALAQDRLLALQWHVPHALSQLQRYSAPDHADLALFRAGEQDPRLSVEARSSLLFALAKAQDDLGDVAGAAHWLIQANALCRRQQPWARKPWKRRIAARLAAPPAAADDGHVGETAGRLLLIVGMPRSGTSLLARLLGESNDVRNRGELDGLARIAAADGTARARELQRYRAQLHRDDPPAAWYVDKQPLNWLHLDLALSLFPGARVIHCQREARDVALSLWSQPLDDPAHAYAADWQAMGEVMGDCRRLLERHRRHYPGRLFTVDYEQLVTQSDATVAELRRWLGLDDTGDKAAPAMSSIATASVWQARQPVHRHSIARWQRYLPHLPPLSGIPGGPV